MPTPDELRTCRQQYELLRAVARHETAVLEKQAALMKMRPSRFLPVLVYHDGLRWVCSYGVAPDSIAEMLPERASGGTGVEAYGANPEEATHNFDKMWVGAISNEDSDNELS